MSTFALLWIALLAQRSGAPADPQLPALTVSSTRLDRAPAFATPASISVVALDGDANRPLVNLSEVLGAVPGMQARDRQNYAQDVQLSIRGFGARSTFGVRGIRLYADGIPATLPDGQGQVAHFSLLGGERVEVLRGPFSALYGNSAGGVVLIESAGGSDELESRLQAGGGSFDSQMVGARLRGRGAGEMLGFNLAASRFQTEGYRRHSAARRETVNLKLELGQRSSQDRQIALISNHFDSQAQDPLGLTREQVQADPRQAPLAEQFNTRKSARQDQVGLHWRENFQGGGSLRAMVYGGRREVEQYLAVPPTAQTNPLNSGGVVDLGADYGGGDLRWTWTGALAGRSLEFSLGSSLDQLRQSRRGFENFVGSSLGVRGALRRNERNRVSSNDQYLQAWWQLGDSLSLLAGMRHSRLRFRSDDHFISATNPDDSGRVDYSATTPVFGLSLAVRPNFNLHIAAGRGFETPTFNELSYRSDGGAGLAFELRPATSDNLEIGAKWHGNDGASAEMALFRAASEDEIAVARNVGGRSSFRNVGRARRQGAEAGISLPLSESTLFQLSYTRLDARFRDAFPVCTGSSCSNPTRLVRAGTPIPGVARDLLFSRLQWLADDWTAAIEASASGAVSVNDAGTERTAGYGLLHLELARSWSTRAGRLRSFVRIDNLLDRSYIGSVIVNEGNARYYEPGPGRGLWLGGQWSWPD